MKVNYLNSNGDTRPMFAVKTHGNGTVDLAYEEGMDAVVTSCPLSDEPKAGNATPVATDQKKRRKAASNSPTPPAGNSPTPPAETEGEGEGEGEDEGEGDK